MRSLEDKVNRSSFPSLLYFMIGFYAVGSLITMFVPQLYFYLCFDAGSILRGEVWRLITYLGASGDSNIFLCLLTCFIYFSLGKSLEQFIGKFRLDFFLVVGIILQWIYGFAWYIITRYVPALFPYIGATTLLDPYYIYTMLFVLFSLIFPDARFLLMFIIPIRGKWMIFITVALDFILVIQMMTAGAFAYAWFIVGMIVFSLINLIVFLLVFNREKYRPSFKRSPVRMRAKKTASAQSSSAPKHRCAVCGRTELTNPELEFRYCSQCIGLFEYCNEHIHTHTHKRPGQGV